jgi:AcrB/AcrD/AcrF family
VVMVPLIISGNIAGQEIASPMAIVILGGLVTSTLLNLFIVPSLYLRFGARSQAHPSTEIPQIQYESSEVAGSDAYITRRNQDES